MHKFACLWQQVSSWLLCCWTSWYSPNMCSLSLSPSLSHARTRTHTRVFCIAMSVSVVIFYRSYLEKETQWLKTKILKIYSWTYFLFIASLAIARGILVKVTSCSKFVENRCLFILFYFSFKTITGQLSLTLIFIAFMFFLIFLLLLSKCISCILLVYLNCVFCTF